MRSDTTCMYVCVCVCGVVGHVHADLCAYVRLVDFFEISILLNACFDCLHMHVQFLCVILFLSSFGYTERNIWRDAYI